MAASVGDEWRESARTGVPGERFIEFRKVYAEGGLAALWNLPTFSAPDIGAL